MDRFQSLHSTDKRRWNKGTGDSSPERLLEKARERSASMRRFETVVDTETEEILGTYHNGALLNEYGLAAD